MDQITIKTPNPKCRLFLKILPAKDLAAGVYLSEAPFPLLGFCLGCHYSYFVHTLVAPAAMCSVALTAMPICLPLEMTSPRCCVLETTTNQVQNMTIL